MESHLGPMVFAMGTPPPDLPPGLVPAGVNPRAAAVAGLIADGRRVLVTAVPADPSEADPDVGDPALLAAVSVYAWLGARYFQVPADAVASVRQVLDMVDSIKGSRPPALSRRGLA